MNNTLSSFFVLLSHRIRTFLHHFIHNMYCFIVRSIILDRIQTCFFCLHFLLSLYTIRLDHFQCYNKSSHYALPSIRTHLRGRIPTLSEISNSDSIFSSSSYPHPPHATSTSTLLRPPRKAWGYSARALFWRGGILLFFALPREKREKRVE